MTFSNRTGTVTLMLGALLVTGCSEDLSEAVKQATESAVESSRKAAARLTEELSAIDLEAVDPALLRVKAEEAMTWSLDRIEEVRDSETAQAISEKLMALVETTGMLLQAAKAEVTDREKMLERVERVREELGQRPEVARYLMPPLDKLAGLLGDGCLAAEKP